MLTKKPKKPQRRLNFYLDAELVQLFQTIRRLEVYPEWYWRCMFTRFSFGTGVRINEARLLRVEDCNPDFFIVTAGKGGKVSYPEPAPEFKPYYQEHLAKCQRENRTWFFDESGKHGPLRKLCNKPLGLRTLRNWWRDVCGQAGIRYLTPHEAGRKTFGSWYKEILDPYDMQAQMGHSSYKTTSQFYTGDIPGRRFNKPEPEWKKWAAPPEEEKGLRVIAGGKG